MSTVSESLWTLSPFKHLPDVREVHLKTVLRLVVFLSQSLKLIRSSQFLDRCDTVSVSRCQGGRTHYRDPEANSQ